ncbi:MAG TPA: ABC transporter substrate-binding protein, partial [Anaerolineae bacterium]
MRRIVLLGFVVTLLIAGCAPAASPAAPAQPSVSGATAAPSAPAPAAAPTAAPVSAAAAAPTGRPLTKVTLAMGYIPNVQFAPFYVAQERGYFRDAGLDVNFNYGMESDLIKLVGTNQLQFMIGSGDQVVLGRSQDIPVRYVMRWYRNFPVVVFAKADKGIKAPKDLEGKTVGISALAGASYVAWKALVYAAGIDASKVNLQVVGYTQVASVTQNRVDAALDYSVNGPVQMRLANQPVTVMPVSDYMDLPSNGLITNDQTIRDHPDLVRALVQATLRGLKDTLADPDAAFAASLRAVPEAGGDQTKVNRAIFDESVKLWQPGSSPLGQSDPTMWTKAAAFMQQTGLVDRAVPATDLFSNQFVTG